MTSSEARPAGLEGRAILCEIAWEVCQQLGGIYTVMRSKAPAMVERWGARYLAVGPFDAHAANAEFEETPAEGPVAAALEALRDEGFDARHGTWLITGRPRVVLLDPRSAIDRVADAKYALWEHHGISPPGGDDLVDRVIAFGDLVRRFVAALVAAEPAGTPVLAHFHEWMAGTAIPEIRRLGPRVGLVFTTHATQLGRMLAAAGSDFYDHLPEIDWLGAARHYGVEAKVRLERAAAHGAHVFTTVSGITAFECEHLLGRRPEVLLPNGLNIERFTAVHEFQNLHRLYKEQIHQFVMAHFFPSYTFDLDRTVYFFSAGRWEYHNKGYDLVIEALARLNARLREAKLDRTVVFFLVTQRPFTSINAEALRSRAVMDQMRTTCEAIKDQVGGRLFAATAMGERPALDRLVDDYWMLRLRRVAHAWKTHRRPLLVTHELADPTGDEVLRQMHACLLFNTEDHAVKVVYHPDFITSSNPLFGMDYDQFVRGCHLGIFPSYYEPWGYTPLECVASGVPAVTSDLAGFGTYLLEHVPDHAERGLTVLARRHRSFDASAAALTEALLEFLAMDRRERIDQRNRVESLAGHFDWSNLAPHYDEAHGLALARLAGDPGGFPV